jgi:hypothetical protein
MSFALEFNALHLLILYAALSLIGVLWKWAAGHLLGTSADPLAKAMLNIAL